MRGGACSKGPLSVRPDDARREQPAAGRDTEVQARRIAGKITAGRPHGAEVGAGKGLQAHLRADGVTVGGFRPARRSICRWSPPHSRFSNSRAGVPRLLITTSRSPSKSRSAMLMPRPLPRVVPEFEAQFQPLASIPTRDPVRERIRWLDEAWRRSLGRPLPPAARARSARRRILPPPIWSPSSSAVPWRVLKSLADRAKLG